MSLSIEHVENLNIHLGSNGGLPTALLAALMGSFKITDLQPGNASAFAQSSAAPRTVPAIGSRWEEHGGIYAGVSRGIDGELDGHIVLLDDKPGKMKWADAVKWGESLDNGARLPTRFESALLYANLQDQFDTDSYHWTGTQYSEYDAWVQTFGYGGQHGGRKSSEFSARAVRRLAL